MRAIREIASNDVDRICGGPGELRTCARREACAETRCPAANAGVCGFRWRHYCFGLAQGAAREHSTGLIERLYKRRGYRCTPPAHNGVPRTRLPLAGADGSRLFATLTLGLDGPNGLLADELYRHEIDAFRADERTVCELCAFAVDPAYSAHGVLVSLFRLAYLYGRRLHRVSDAFIEVNPRHVGFYERIMGFERCGEQRECPRVGAPAVLMHLDVATAGSP